MKNRVNPDALKRVQSGFALLESLVAILLLAIGVMGLAALQTRSLVDMRHSNARANALLLANDLSERMRINRQSALLPTSTYKTNVNVANWDSSIPAVTTSCINNVCTGAQLATFDLNEWRVLVGQLLPGGQAQISDPVNNQITVTFRWRNNITGANSGQTDQTEILMSPFIVPISGCQSISDQGKWICHQMVITP